MRVTESVFRPGGVSYLRIPAPDPDRSAAFYRDVFGWEAGDGRFTDASGLLIGHFMTDLPVAGEAGIIPYVYVRDIDAALEKAAAAGGEIATAPYPEGDLWVAVLRDPAGNAIGAWQRGPRLREAQSPEARFPEARSPGARQQNGTAD